MRFNLPKPLHGWREFFGEVGIIVLGVMIALGAGQAIDSWRGEQTLMETETRLRAELGVNLANAYERLAITECLTGRIIQLRDKLTEPDNNWTADQAKLAKDVLFNAFPAVYRSPARTWPQEAWRTATSNDGLNYAAAEQVSQLASLYSSVAQMEQVQAGETSKSSELGDLAFSGPLTGSERRDDLKILAELSAKNTLMVFLANLVLKEAAKNGYQVSEQVRLHHLTQQRNYRGSCVIEVPYPRP